ncbi:PepSY domain-containing protein [Stackebrandtia soli]|uniref:PepSY domain-containing protein n=1 Tax=Stackebrandtia soli TaxID=1892856 RepID=UPI0039E799DB
MKKSLQTRRRTWIITGAAGALILGSAVAAGAAFADDEDPQRDPGTVTAESVGDRDDDDREDDDRDDEDGVSVPSDMISPADAADVAVAEIGDGLVTSVELDDDGNLLVWDVDAVDADQVEHELTIHAVDGTVLSHEKEDDDADTIDHARASAATVTIQEATSLALSEVPNGRVIGVELQGGVDAPVWEVEVYNTSDETWQYVEIDAVNGTLISVNDDYSAGDDDGDDRDDNEDGDDD